MRDFGLYTVAEIETLEIEGKGDFEIKMELEFEGTRFMPESGVWKRFLDLGEGDFKFTSKMPIRM